MEKILMNGIIIVVPILLIRFLLLSLLNKEAVRRAAFYPPVQGIEKMAYWINIITTFLLIIVPFFLQINLHGPMGIFGLCFLIPALILYSISIIQFARPDDTGFNKSGFYNISRNPMYVAFFLYFLGSSMLTRSWLLLIILLIFQISVHFMIISEERWCKEKFGEPFNEYMKKVRRYL